jgi:hypothetical protein
MKKKKQNLLLNVDCNGTVKFESHNRIDPSDEHDNNLWPDNANCQTASVWPSNTLHNTFESLKKDK